MVERSRTLDDVYASLAHPVRRKMLNELRAGERRVTELCDPFAISLAAASKHISHLERAGLVTRRVAGRDHWIALNAEPLAEAERWLALYRSYWNRRLDRLETLVTESTNG
jgi:DNA-binding transcriptional ArsR family regulator